MKVSYVVLRYLLTDHTGSLNFCIDGKHFIELGTNSLS